MPDPADTPTPPEPQARGAGPVAILFALFSLALAIGWQNLPEDAQRKALWLPPLPQVEPLPFDIFDPAPMQAKIHIQAAAEIDDLSPGQGAQLRAQAQTAVDAAAESPGDRIGAAIVAGELEGPEAALARLDAVEDELNALDRAEAAPAPTFDPFGIATGRRARLDDYLERRRAGLREDLPLLRTLYAEGSDALTDDQRDRIASRYHYLGRLALAWDAGEGSPARAEVLHGGTLWRLVGLVAFMLVAGGALLAGVVVLILAMVALGSGKLRPLAPRPPVHGGALLEAVGLFALLFVIMGAGSTWLAQHHPKWGIIQLPLQWSLILVPFWPLLRGWRVSDWRAAVGLTRGRGVLREIWAGTVGYLAALPLFAAGAVLSVLVTFADATLLGESPVAPTNPVIDILVGADWLTVLLIGSLACVWAPVCEEMVFRGCLFSQVRRRLGWVLAAVLSTLAFAYMHSYGPLILWPILALGFSFAVIRWWRGSLIACITAHALHNTSLTLMMLVLVGLFPA